MLPQLGMSKVDTGTAALTPLSLQRVWHAHRFWARLRGLLGRPELALDEGLMLSPCRQVHTFGLRYTLDVVYLDKQGRIVKCAPSVAPNRVSGSRLAWHTLELAQGAIAQQGLAVGDQLMWKGI